MKKISGGSTTAPMRPIHVVAFSEMWNFSAMGSFIAEKVSTMYSAMAIAPMPVRTGASRGRCNRLWCALSPVNFFSRYGHTISSPNTRPMPRATQVEAGMV